MYRKCMDNVRNANGNVYKINANCMDLSRNVKKMFGYVWPLLEEPSPLSSGGGPGNVWKMCRKPLENLWKAMKMYGFV